MSTELECIDPSLGDMLTAHVNGTLSPGEGRLFAGHLAACARCEEDVRTLRALRSAIAELPPGESPDAPSGAAARGLAGIRGASIRPGPAGWPALVMGVALASFAVGSWWQARRPSDVSLRVRELEARVARVEARSERASVSAVASASSRGERAPEGTADMPAIGLTKIRALLVAPTFDDLLAGRELHEVGVPGTRVESGSMRVLASDGTPIGYYAGDVRVLRNEEYAAPK